MPSTAPAEVSEVRIARQYGLPYLGADEQDPPNPHFASGTDPYRDGPQTPAGDLATTLFGALDGVLNFLPSGVGR